MSDTLNASAAAGSALIKIFGIPVLTGSLAAALGFMFMWPQTKKEAFSRFACSILSSATIGPLAVVWLRSYKPDLFESAKAIALLAGTEEAVGFLFIAAPIMVAAGLPAWWIIGAVVRWFDNRRDKDIGQMGGDVIDLIKRGKDLV